jgi:two-component system, cell cycle sensor histidine kinase and response regulator CckA
MEVRPVAISRTAREDDAAVVLDTIPDAYVHLDAEFRFTFVNRAAERLLGQPREELAGKTPWEVRPDCAQATLETSLRAAKAGSAPYTFENYYEPSGRWYAIRAVPDAGGLVVHFSDVTDLKRAEEHRRLIFDDSPVGMFRTTPDGRLLAANRSFAQILHYDSADEMVAAISDVAHQVWANPDDREKVIRMTDEQGFVRGLECEYKCKDGAVVWVSASGRKVTGPDGGTLYYEGYVEDITQRRERDEALRQAEEVIRHRERQLSTIYESVVEALFLLAVEPGEQYRFVTVNATLLRMTGLKAEQVVGKFVHQVIPEPSLSLVLTKYRQAISERTIVRWEETTTFPAGTKCGDVSVTPIVGENGVCTHLVGTVHDTTEGRRTAVEKEHLREQLRQAQKLESIGRLAGGVAHDFNNTLVVINGYAELLADRLSPLDPLREYALEIRKAGENAAGLTSQLLAFSRKQVIKPRPLDLNAVVRDAERMLRRLIGEDIEFVIQPEAESAWVMADHAQIHQVIVNLAANARDAMPDGGRLGIATANVDVDEELAAASPGAAPGSYVLTSFTDTGAGMPEEVRQNIFEPFFTTKEQGKGTGLGLATVYGIIRQNGGWIEVDSRVGEGTSFRIYLPRTHALPAVSDRDPKAPDKPNGGVTVMIVEDQDAVRRLTKLTLGSLGYHVLEAESGARACELAATFPGEIHLLLSDIVMPGMNGRELAGELLKLRPNIKVLLMSGYAEESILHDGPPEPELPFLHKPFTQDLLAVKVREVLRG